MITKISQRTSPVLQYFNDGPACVAMAELHQFSSHRTVSEIREHANASLRWIDDDLAIALTEADVKYTRRTMQDTSISLFHKTIDAGGILLLRLNMRHISKIGNRVGRRYRLPFPWWTQWVALTEYNLLRHNTALVMDPWESGTKLGCILECDEIVDALTCDVFVISAPLS